MEFEKEELKVIKCALEQRERNLSKNIEELEKANWNNIGTMQNMFVSEQAFKDYKDNMIKTNKTEIKDIDNLLDKIYEEI